MAAKCLKHHFHWSATTQNNSFTIQTANSSQLLNHVLNYIHLFPYGQTVEIEAKWYYSINTEIFVVKRIMVKNLKIMKAF